MYNFEVARSQDLPRRLPLPFAILIATLSLLSYLINESSHSISNVGELIYWLVFMLSGVTAAVGAWFFRAAWFGHSDKLFAVPNEVESYHATLRDTYNDFDDCDKLVEEYFDQYLLMSYAEFGSHIANNNDRRSFSLYVSLCCFTASSAVAFLALFIHFFLHNG